MKKSLYEELFHLLAQYHRRAWVLVENRAGKWAVLDQWNGLTFITDWVNDADTAVAAAELKLRAGEVSIEGRVKE